MTQPLTDTQHTEQRITEALARDCEQRHERDRDEETR